MSTLVSLFRKQSYFFIPPSLGLANMTKCTMRQYEFVCTCLVAVPLICVGVLAQWFPEGSRKINVRGQEIINGIRKNQKQLHKSMLLFFSDFLIIIAVFL